MMMGKLLRFGKRQLHTLISSETIKPSSPTHIHLKTYNLSLIDQIAPRVYVPFVLLYPNYGLGNTITTHEKTQELKNSLSQTLTRYYPFAGRLATCGGAFVDCNDEGVEFMEARTDSQLSDFLHNSEHKTLDQLFPSGLVWDSPYYKGGSSSTSLVAVHLSHFACGGIALAVSMSHKIADGSTLSNFLSHWAAVTHRRFGDHEQAVPINPHFISFSSSKLSPPEVVINKGKDIVTRKFVFPNSKIEDLKGKVKSMASELVPPITNPTRVEVLNSLLYKCAVAAATTANSGSFKSSCLAVTVNMRHKMVEPLPETCVGNIYSSIIVPTKNVSEIMLNSLIAEIKKAKMQLGKVRNLQEIGELLSSALSTVDVNDAHVGMPYVCSNLCRFPFYQVDFGWGKPIKVTLAGAPMKNTFIFMDTPCGDGIEALATLEKQHMAIFQNHEELLAFC